MIEPSFFYYVQLLDAINISAQVICALCCGRLVAILASVGFENLFDGAEFLSKIKKYQKIIKPLSFSIIITVLIMIFLPTRETAILMKAASLSTTESLEALKTAILEILTAIKDFHG